MAEVWATPLDCPAVVAASRWTTAESWSTLLLRLTPAEWKGQGDVPQDEADEQGRERDRAQGDQHRHQDGRACAGGGARWVTVTTARAATNTPTSRARYPFTDIRTSSSRLEPFPTWWYRVPAGPVEPPAALTAGGRAAWMAAVDTWDPAQYERFAAERAAPFHDLLSLVRPVPGGRVVDLGCGGGS